MSDIKINVPEDTTILILKRIQNKISGYKGYKEGGDVRISTQALYDDIRKRIEISLSNLKAAIDNLEMYDKADETIKVKEVYGKIEELGKLEIDFPKEAVPILQTRIQNLYFSDEIGFKNSIDLLDNINSFRSASISGDSDRHILGKIVSNVDELGKFTVERNASLNRRN